MEFLDILPAILSFAGTALGTLGGIMATSKLTAYRIEQLEHKVEKHNSIVERTYRLEEDAKNFRRELDEAKQFMISLNESD